MQVQDDYLKMQARCISHEIRNQVSISEVYCEIIRKHLEKNNVSIPAVENALNCIQKSAKIVNNSLLDLKSLANYDYKVLSLYDVLTQAIEMSRVYVHDKNIEFELEQSQNAYVEVDENKFLACLVNLLKNAIEAIDEVGWVKISVEVIDDKVSIKIINNGQKISEEVLNKIFNEGLTTKSYGSGLGLFICKQNLETMNAQISLNFSKEDMTEFEIVMNVKNLN